VEAEAGGEGRDPSLAVLVSRGLVEVLDDAILGEVVDA
jgi:hypothetical protein